jgi:hypothetical protein
VPVALEVGPNEIVVRRNTYREWGDPPATSSSPLVVHVTRVPSPGDDTGVLDLATAHFFSGYGEGRYEVCGEVDGCATDTRCFALGPRRVDCPVFNYSVGEDHVRRCALVATVRLRGEHIHHDTYPCRGRLRPDARRFVRAAFWSRGVRLRPEGSGHETHEWFRAETNNPNRYGPPRFDVDRDVFLP